VEVLKAESPVEYSEPRPRYTGLNLSIDSASHPDFQGEPEFDLDAPLEFATQIIVDMAAAAGRPMDISLMTPEQQRDEKIAVKRQLRNFDFAWKAKYGVLVC
jgi:hypothetical protein